MSGVERVDGWWPRRASRPRLAGEQSPPAPGPVVPRPGYRRTARGRGVESEDIALKRGRLDATIAGLLFMARMRRGEVSALRWADVVDAAADDGVLVTVRRGKTNPEGEARDVRFVKGDVAGAVRMLRDAASPEPEDQVVPLSPQMVGLRFQAVTRAVGVEARVTSHSARAGLGVGADESGRVGGGKEGPPTGCGATLLRR